MSAAIFAARACNPSNCTESQLYAAKSDMSSKPSSSSTGPGSVRRGLRFFQNWVRLSLLQLYAPPNAVVCELLCGVVADLSKYAKLKVSRLVAVEGSQRLLEEARKRWGQKGKPFPLVPLRADALRVRLSPSVLGSAAAGCDVCACFTRFDVVFGSQQRAKTFFSNVQTVLKPGGYFVAYSLDAPAVWAAATKHKGGARRKVPLRSGHHSSSEYLQVKTEFQPFGTKVVLSLDKTPRPQGLVHTATLIDVARSHGLSVVSCLTFEEFYEQNQELFASGLRSLNVVNSKGRLTVPRDILAYFSAVVFRAEDKDSTKRKGTEEPQPQSGDAVPPKRTKT